MDARHRTATAVFALAAVASIAWGARSLGAAMAGTTPAAPVAPDRQGGPGPLFPALQAEPVVDQTTCDEPWEGAVSVSRTTWKAQTFVAGMDGRLVRVDLPGTNRGGATQLEIWPVDGCGLEHAQALAVAEVEAGTRFAFADPPLLVAGSAYALVLRGGPQPSGYSWAYSGRSNCYHGRLSGPYTSTDAGQTWSRDIVDFFFTTWMLPDAAPATPAPTEHASGASAQQGRTTWSPRGPAPGGDPARAARDAHDARVRAGSPAANAAALDRIVARAAQRPSALDTRTVFVISLPTGNSDPVMLLQKSRDLAAAVREASAFHGYADPAAPPALDYRIYQDTVFAEAVMPRRCGGTDYDLGALYDKHRLCDLIQRGEIDEVWFWDGGQGGVPEWAANGPEWEFVLGTGMPDCGRQTALMVFNNTRELDVALHSLGHRFEWTMRIYRPCDFTSETWPWDGRSAGCRDGSASDATGFVARPFEGNGFVGACGDVHWPPNLPRGVGADYDYDYGGQAQSICPDWRRDGQARETTISCRTWGCTQMGYMVWWMQNIPGEGNASRDAAGRPMPSWWPYLFGTGVGAAPPTATATLSTPAISPSPSTSPTATPPLDPTPVDPPVRGLVHLPALSNEAALGAAR